MAKLIVDTRERSVLEHADVFGEINHEVKQITVGDYVITTGDVIRAVIERKSLDDYAASMKDGRHGNVEKLRELRDETGCRIIYLVEIGCRRPSPDRMFGRIKFSSIESSIFHLMMRDNITVIWTQNTADTAATLGRFMRSVDTLYPPNEYAVVGGDDPTVADRLTMRREKSACTILCEMWSAIKGVGAGNANEICKTVTLEQLVRGDLVQLRAVRFGGRLLSARVINSATHPPEIEILSRVPGVSRKRASALLTGRTTAELLDLGKDGFAKLVVDGRKVGPGLASRIIDIYTMTA